VSTGRDLPWDWNPDPLPDNVEVGNRSWVYSSFAFLHHRSTVPAAVRIGDDSGIYDGTMFETGPYGRVDIGEFCAVAGAIFATNGLVSIGDFGFVGYGVVFADSVAPVPADTFALPSGSQIAIRENVWIGTRATILSGARIGEGAVIGALSVVDSEIPPFAIAAGNPARVVGSAQPAHRRGT
jgi:carbonic anhydrase/acetyltransferase-like protein (isoleucine patch superfamily)